MSPFFISKNKQNQPIAKSVPFNRRLSFWLILLVIVISYASVKKYTAYSQQFKQPPALPVVVATAIRRDVPIYLNALGNVTPTYTVTVRTQINGQLMQVLYKEGQLVKSGELLAEIDDRPYLAQLKQYEGQYARDKAQLVNALIDLKRYQVLWKQDSVSKQTLDTQSALVKQLEGSIQLDEGLLEATRVNLIYCKITSPIAGRIGLRLVDPGNYVQTSDTNGIALITMLNPITVVFTIPEDSINAVWQNIASNKELLVEAFDRQQIKLLAVGQLLTIDNVIDPTTGTVKLKAQFQNDKDTLFPNQFVNVRLLVKTLHQATIIPTAAIQFQPDKKIVYVLDENKTVHVKTVVTSVTINENTVILSGISAGQLVVTEGTDKLKDGMKVDVKNTDEAVLSKKRHVIA